jgi:hypothetical protein
MKYLMTIGYYDYYVFDGYVYRIVNYSPVPIMDYSRWMRRMEVIKQAQEAALK